ncbi:LysR family transcriptional regulator [Subtercola sp. RTI3]|uniref:LysR family transcriptional regulator n=1 Tax=Subtercola sp. RTI3 TaxID=3048639 RepID=UPI002B225673|nr:LysR family transcriptional regulator [Subtercola sp. RTI3]MEA9986228.1 LysR family transcriptional regulator [Subtercola sp. RTI3]
MLDIRKLTMLAELDELGTIAAVARSLRLTAPGISMQLAALEREVGVKLTERQGRRVVVTPAGRLLSRHAREIGDRLAVAESEAVALREGAVGTYRVAAFPTAARSYVAEAWAGVLGSLSQRLTLRLTELEPGPALKALAAGEVEVAVTHSYSNMAPRAQPGLVATSLLAEPVLLATRESGVMAQDARSAVDLADFADADWVLPHREWTCFEMVQRACGLAGFEPRCIAEATDYSVQLALVAAGAGVALVPRSGALQMPEGVVLRPLSVPVTRHHFAVIRRGSTADSGLARVLQLLGSAAKNVGGDSGAESFSGADLTFGHPEASTQ